MLVSAGGPVAVGLHRAALAAAERGAHASSGAARRGRSGSTAGSRPATRAGSVSVSANRVAHPLEPGRSG